MSSFDNNKENINENDNFSTFEKLIKENKVNVFRSNEKSWFNNYDYYKKLINVLKKNTSVYTLDFSYYGVSKFIIRDKNIDLLCDLISINKNIKRLNLKSNYIGDNGVKKLCKMLKSNNTIKYLDLSGNESISSSGIHEIASMIKENKSIKYLNVKQRLIYWDNEDYIFDEIITSLECNTSLIDFKFPFRLTCAYGFTSYKEKMDINEKENFYKKRIKFLLHVNENPFIYYNEITFKEMKYFLVHYGLDDKYNEFKLYPFKTKKLIFLFLLYNHNQYKVINMINLFSNIFYFMIEKILTKMEKKYGPIGIH